MSAANTTDMDNLAPELAGESTPRKQIFLDIAAKMISETAWSSGFQQAHASLACHFMTLANRGGAAGAVTGVKVGEVSVNYGSSPEWRKELGTTSYGMMFLMLRDATIVNPLVL